MQRRYTGKNKYRYNALNNRYDFHNMKNNARGV